MQSKTVFPLSMKMARQKIARCLKYGLMPLWRKPSRANFILKWNKNFLETKNTFVMLSAIFNSVS